MVQPWFFGNGSTILWSAMIYHNYVNNSLKLHSSYLKSPKLSLSLPPFLLPFLHPLSPLMIVRRNVKFNVRKFSLVDCFCSRGGGLSHSLYPVPVTT